jgi:hypothetical protein
MFEGLSPEKIHNISDRLSINGLATLGESDTPQGDADVFADESFTKLLVFAEMVEILVDNPDDSAMILIFIARLFDYAEIWRDLEREFEKLSEMDVEAIYP